MIAEPLVRTFIPPPPVRERALRLVKPRPEREDLKLQCLIALLSREIARLQEEERQKTYLSDLRIGDKAYLSPAAVAQDVEHGTYRLCLEAMPAFIQRAGYPIAVKRTEEGYLLRIPQGTCIMSEEAPFSGRAASTTVEPYRMGTWSAKG